MHQLQADVNAEWTGRGLFAFGLGIGLSTGPVAAALLGTDERDEYTLVGDTVTSRRRLLDAARPAGTTVASAETIRLFGIDAWVVVEMQPLKDKGRESAVAAYTVEPSGLERPSVTKGV